MLRARLVPKRLEAGCDEVGRGCLAGPVVAAAVILKPGFKHPDLQDSKMLTGKKRHELRVVIEREAIAWSVSFIHPVIVDRINVLNASFLGMERAVKRLGVTPEHLLIDGHLFRSTLSIPHECLIKGDGRIGSIAAASILAKTYRDEYMRLLHEDHPHYGWSTNVGYPTVQHRQALSEYGPCAHHRKSFQLFSDQLELDL